VQETLSREREEKKRTIEQLEEELRRLQVANTELHASLAECEQQRAATEEDRQAQRLRCQALSKQLKGVEETRRQATAEYERRITVLQEEIKCAREGHAAELTTTREAYEARLHDLEDELTQTQATTNAMQASHADELRGLQHELQQCRLARDATMEAQHSSAAQLRTAQTTIRELRSSLRTLKAKASGLRRELAKQQSFVASQLKAHGVSLKHLAEHVTAKVHALENHWREQLQRERQYGESRLAEMDAVHKAELKEVEHAHASTLRETTQQHDEYLQQLHEHVAELQERLKELEEEEQRRIDRVMAKEDARRARLQAEHEREISELHAMFEAQLDQLVQTHRRELAASDQALVQARQAGEERLQQTTQEHKEATDRLLADLNAARDSMAGMMATIQAQELALMHAMEQIAAGQSRHSSDDRGDRSEEPSTQSLPEPDQERNADDDRHDGHDELQKLVEERHRLLASMAELEDQHAALRAAFVRQKQELEDVRLLVEAITNDDAPESAAAVAHKSANTENDAAATNAVDAPRQSATSGAPLTRLAMKKRRRPGSCGAAKETTMQKAIAGLLSRRLRREMLRFSFLRWQHAHLQRVHHEQLSAQSTTDDTSADISKTSVAAEVAEGPAEGESFWTVSTTDSEHTSVFHNFV
jgi:hypothetical protein